MGASSLFNLLPEKYSRLLHLFNGEADSAEILKPSPVKEREGEQNILFSNQKVPDPGGWEAL